MRLTNVLSMVYIIVAIESSLFNILGISDAAFAIVNFNGYLYINWVYSSKEYNFDCNLRRTSSKSFKTDPKKSVNRFPEL